MALTGDGGQLVLLSLIVLLGTVRIECPKYILKVIEVYANGV